jgi:hypothetical protein
MLGTWLSIFGNLVDIAGNVIKHFGSSVDNAGNVINSFWNALLKNSENFSKIPLNFFASAGN